MVINFCIFSGFYFTERLSKGEKKNMDETAPSRSAINFFTEEGKNTVMEYYVETFFQIFRAYCEVRTEKNAYVSFIFVLF